MRILLITIFKIFLYMYEAPHHDISICMRLLITYSICIFRYMRLLFTIFKTSHYVFSEILNFEVNVTSRYKKYPSVCISKYSLVRTIVCMFSSRYLDISLAKKKLQYLTVIQYMRWLIYILLIVPIIRFIKLPGTSINWFYFN